MKCLVSGVNVKVFARAIHTLCRIGDELYIEPAPDGLCLKTVNSSRSAYAIFKFDEIFFTSYSNVSENTMGQKDTPENVLRCRLPMKSILTIFRSISFVEKNVESCKISLPWIEALLIFELKCKYGITKTFNLRFQDADVLEPVFSDAAMPNVITCSAKLCSDALVNFHSGVEEITWTISAERVRITNFIDDTEDVSKAVHTELTLSKEEFEQYAVSSDTEVTFSLKDFKSIVGFAEPNASSLSLRIEAAGKPMLLNLCNTPAFKADFLMATLSPPSGTGSYSSSIQNRSTSIQRRGSSVRATTLPPESPRSLQVTRTSFRVEANQMAPEEMQVDLPAEVCDNPPVDGDPQGPPSKRMRVRKFFQRCFDSTFNPTNVPGSENVLAPDSDEEI